MYDDIEGLEEFDESLLAQPAAGAAGGAGDEEGEGMSPSITSGNNSPISPIHSSGDGSSDPEKRRKSSDDSSQVVRPVAMKPSQPNHSSPSPVVKGVGAVGTPPKAVGTPNNSSPSSGLSNHVSSLSSLSSSPTHNYHNALSNSKSIGELLKSQCNVQGQRRITKSLTKKNECLSTFQPIWNRQTTTTGLLRLF